VVSDEAGDGGWCVVRWGLRRAGALKGGALQCECWVAECWEHFARVGGIPHDKCWEHSSRTYGNVITILTGFLVSVCLCFCIYVFPLFLDYSGWEDAGMLQRTIIMGIYGAAGL
jgi:hypothetical protein